MCVGFYNLENFYDTIDDPKKSDEDFLPNGAYHYTSAVYKEKVSHLSDVISQLGKDASPDGVALMGVAEIENETVLNDLVAQPSLQSAHLKIVHYDSPDERGVDVAMLYNPKYFKVLRSEPLFVAVLKNENGSIHYTRDILWVYGELDGEPVHVFVNHWPSRRGSGDASAPGRVMVAAICKHVVDSLMKVNINTKVIVMGDLNDDPTSPSVAKALGAEGNIASVKSGGLYNPWVDFYKKGTGTLAYNDSWNLFDQVMFSSAFLKKEQPGAFFYQAHIFNKDFLITKTGKFKGYPLRTYSGTTYNGGYSDHFPVYTVLLKETK
ncbi:MAG: endonuclease/exonuclease/phosphatase [Bacteroidota bacterium]|nr:endonuclease/exonuclease/phosphatase [Bacteroidota bacterium]